MRLNLFNVYRWTEHSISRKHTSYQFRETSVVIIFTCSFSVSFFSISFPDHANMHMNIYLYRKMLTFFRQSNNFILRRRIRAYLLDCVLWKYQIFHNVCLRDVSTSSIHSLIDVSILVTQFHFNLNIFDSRAYY